MRALKPWNQTAGTTGHNCAHHSAGTGPAQLPTWLCRHRVTQSGPHPPGQYLTLRKPPLLLLLLLLLDTAALLAAITSTRLLRKVPPAEACSLTMSPLPRGTHAQAHPRTQAQPSPSLQVVKLGQPCAIQVRV